MEWEVWQQRKFLAYQLIRHTCNWIEYHIRIPIIFLSNFTLTLNKDFLNTGIFTLDGSSIACSRKWCLRHGAILQTKTKSNQFIDSARYIHVHVLRLMVICPWIMSYFCIHNESCDLWPHDPKIYSVHWFCTIHTWPKFGRNPSINPIRSGRTTQKHNAYGYFVTEASRAHGALNLNSTPWCSNYNREPRCTQILTFQYGQLVKEIACYPALTVISQWHRLTCIYIKLWINISIHPLVIKAEVRLFEVLFVWHFPRHRYQPIRSFVFSIQSHHFYFSLDLPFSMILSLSTSQSHAVSSCGSLRWPYW